MITREEFDLIFTRSVSRAESGTGASGTAAAAQHQPVAQHQRHRCSGTKQQRHRGGTAAQQQRRRNTSSHCGAGGGRAEGAGSQAHGEDVAEDKGGEHHHHRHLDVPADRPKGRAGVPGVKHVLSVHLYVDVCDNCGRTSACTAGNASSSSCPCYLPWLRSPCAMRNDPPANTVLPLAPTVWPESMWRRRAADLYQWRLPYCGDLADVQAERDERPCRAHNPR